jgi:glycerophosphoryl diester phosphodiesterase
MKRVKEVMELLFVVGFIVACHVVKKSDLSSSSTFDKQGHRGCRGLMPENTIPAMIKALELGVTTLEMDAVITKDKQVLVSHEPFFSHEIATQRDGKPVNPSEEKNLNIYRMTYFETQQFDVGLKPHPRFLQQQKIPVKKPLLTDLIDSVEEHCRLQKLPLPFYNIETKSQPFTDNLFHPAPEEFVDLVMQVVNQKGIAERTIIQSFDFRTLHVLNKKYPLIKAAALVEDFDKRPIEVHFSELKFTPAIYSPHFSLVNAEMIRKCHARNIKVIPWTVNDKLKIEELRKMGVDGIITDYPDLFKPD